MRKLIQQSHCVRPTAPDAGGCRFAVEVAAVVQVADLQQLEREGLLTEEHWQCLVHEPHPTEDAARRGSAAAVVDLVLPARGGEEADLVLEEQPVEEEGHP